MYYATLCAGRNLQQYRLTRSHAHTCEREHAAPSVRQAATIANKTAAEPRMQRARSHTATWAVQSSNPKKGDAACGDGQRGL